MRETEAVKISYIEGSQRFPRHYDNPELIYVLEGQLALSVDGRSWVLGTDGYILVNAGRPYSYEADRSCFAARFELPLEMLYASLHQSPILFWCCSEFAADEGGSTDASSEELRRLVKQLLFLGISGGDGQTGAERGSLSRPFYEKSTGCQLMGFLVHDFLLSSASPEAGALRQDGQEERMERVLEYLRMNYRNPVSLGEVAAELALSPTYLSKYIRRTSGQSFVGLLNEIRLSHALEDLMYTDSSILRIAMDNGFASIAAFEKVFKDHYGETPSVYRRKKKAASASADIPSKRACSCIRRYLEEHPAVPENAACELVLGHGPVQPTKMGILVNAGSAHDLLKAAVQRELVLSKEQLGCVYVRFWNLFSPEMHLDVLGEKDLNFGLLDEVLDFLLGAGLRPYFVLGRKRHGTFGLAAPEWAPETLVQLREACSSFFAHIIRRYGASEVARWIFSLPAAPDAYREDGRLVFEPLDDAAWQRYLDAFDIVAGTIRARIPQARIGGPDLAPQHVSAERLSELFCAWGRRRNQPSFISFTSFPYQIVRTGDAWYERYRTDMDFAVADVSKVRDALAEAGLQVEELHAVECNLTLSERSYLNDTTMRAAFLARCAGQLADKVDLFGVWNLSDSYSDAADTDSFLFGGPGILAKMSIPKPAFYALEFLGRLYPEMVPADPGCLATVNEHGHMKLLLSNLVRPDAALDAAQSRELSALKVERMGESAPHRLWHMRMQAADGWWQIRRYSVNQTTGSILHEWLNLDLSLELRLQEYDYLRRICVPRLFIEKRCAHGGMLEFDIDMAPNEISYLHITENG